MIRVVIVDDQELLRAGLRVLLEHEDDIAVVGESGDGEAAIAAARACRPDVVLMDISMPVLDGFEATRRIRERVPKANVLILTGSNSRHDVARSREAGAAGYVTKDRIAAELVEAILDLAGPK